MTIMTIIIKPIQNKVYYIKYSFIYNNNIFLTPYCKLRLVHQSRNMVKIPRMLLDHVDHFSPLLGYIACIGCMDYLQWYQDTSKLMRKIKSILVICLRISD